MSRVNLTRMYNSGNGDHYYAVPSQVSGLLGAGYAIESVVGQIEETNVSGTTALYKAYAGGVGDRLYTTDATEYNGLGAGWTKEGIVGYVSSSPTGETLPFYRFYLGSNRHLMTSSLPERYTLQFSGKTYDGIKGGYVFNTAGAGAAVFSVGAVSYSDGRPSPVKRLPVIHDQKVLSHGGTNDTDGMRDVTLYEEAGTYQLGYDGIASGKWKNCGATSTDLVNWTKTGILLNATDHISCYGVIVKQGTGDYKMYYLAASSQVSDTTPTIPYLTYEATATTPLGTWTQGSSPVFCAKDYYSLTASPGPIIEYDDGNGNDYIMFFSAANYVSGVLKRGIGIARSASQDGPWVPDASPIIPLSEQVENISIYQESGHYYLFTNHVGIAGGVEYTDGIIMYWSDDPTTWSTSNKAWVLTGELSWSRKIIGLPAVTKVGTDRLAILYDGKDSTSLTDTGGQHFNRDIGLCWVNLPITT